MGESSQMVAAKRRYLKQENAKYPRQPVEVPREKWPNDLHLSGDGVERLRMWRSRDYLAQLFSSPDGSQRLTINTTELKANGEWGEGLTWDDLQRIKQECGFGDRWAVEVFPPDTSVVNVANMRHLWLLAEPPAYAWQKGRSSNQGGS